jgi:hypothetical protein
VVDADFTKVHPYLTKRDPRCVLPEQPTRYDPVTDQPTVEWLAWKEAVKASPAYGSPGSGCCNSGWERCDCNSVGPDGHLDTGTMKSTYAFQGCNKLKTIHMPEVTRIEVRAFYRAPELTHVYAPKMKELQDYFTARTPKLEAVYLPEVFFIGRSAFNRTPKLKTLRFPKLQHVGMSAFHQMGVTDLYIPAVGKFDNYDNHCFACVGEIRGNPLVSTCTYENAPQRAERPAWTHSWLPRFRSPECMCGSNHDLIWCQIAGTSADPGLTEWPGLTIHRAY